MKIDPITSLSVLLPSQVTTLHSTGVRTIGELYALVVMPSVGSSIEKSLHIDTNQAEALRVELEQHLTESERRELRQWSDVSERLGALLGNDTPPRKKR
jgi:hypothetical protein